MGPRRRLRARPPPSAPAERMCKRVRGRHLPASAAQPPAASSAHLFVSRPATRDLSLCVERALRRVRTGCVAAAPYGDIASAIGASMRDGRLPAACFLLVGAREAGKSAVVRRVLADVRVRAAADGQVVRFAVVALHGLLHSALPAALRAIAAALQTAVDEWCGDGETGGRQAKGWGEWGSWVEGEQERGDDDAKAEDDDDRTDERGAGREAGIRPSSVAACTTAIARAVQEVKAQEGGIVFLLDDFDRFAKHGEAQPVLYNVLNLLQDAQLRAACIGMTTHIDATDALEKRVKSRFSPREIILSSPESASEILQMLQAASVLPVGDDHDDEKSNSDCCPRTTREAGEAVHVTPRVLDNDDVSVVSEFNDIVTSFLEAPAFKAALEEHFLSDRTIGRVVSAFCDTLAALAPLPDAHNALEGLDQGTQGMPRSASLSTDAFRWGLGLDEQFCSTLNGLSVLEMALLVALRKLERKKMQYGGATIANDAFSFEDVYAEYALIKKGGRDGFVSTEGEPVVESSVAAKAWDRLIETAVVVRLGPAQGMVKHVVLGVDPHDVDTAVQEHLGASAFLKRWAKGIVE